MGAIARNAANKITTGGVFTSGAITNDSVTGITVLANASDGITFISSQTASNSASISFTSGLTSTYKAYKFIFVNIHPATDDIHFQFQASTNGGSTYGVTATTTFFEVAHNESDTTTALTYNGTYDLAQSTNFQSIYYQTSNDNDHGGVGTLQLFNPSSTTYVKHFICAGQQTSSPDFSATNYSAGYFNTTSAINAIQFKFSSGNIDAGTIYLYGIK
jgi:hypothetical protein